MILFDKRLSWQATDFINLCQIEGVSVLSIKIILAMLQSNIRNELMEYFKVDNVDDLANIIGK